MPYVAASVKRELDGWPSRSQPRRPITAGELTYVLQQALNAYLTSKPQVIFSDLADCIGALEAAKVDFTDRVLIHYERGKCLQNGDVWDPRLIRQVMGL